MEISLKVGFIPHPLPVIRPVVWKAQRFLLVLSLDPQFEIYGGVFAAEKATAHREARTRRTSENWPMAAAG